MKYAVALAFAAVVSAAEPKITDQWYIAIRAGNTHGVKQMLASGAPMNIRDTKGATPLHYAAAVGNPETMKILIAAGADVNARTEFGATPLLWSTASLDKVQLLISHGADVNARSSMGNTALTAAAAQAGNIAVLRYLLEHGASIPQARNQLGQTPVLRAAGANDFEMVKLLVSRGDDVKSRDAVGFECLMFAAGEGNLEIMEFLISKGANVNAQLENHTNTVKNGPLGIGRLSPLMVAVVSRNPSAVRMLLERGADVNAKDIRGMTSLMLAVASDHAEPEIIRLLLERKPDLASKSELGETAAVWARKFRSPEVHPLIEDGSTEADRQDVTPAAASAGPRDVRTAAEKSLALMQRSSLTFFRNGGCVSCHAQDITAMAVGAARSKGLNVDESAAQEVLRAMRLEFSSRSDQFLERIDGPADTILTTALSALAEQNILADRMTDAMVRNIASQQDAAGYFSGIGIVRPPTSDWNISNTATSIRVLRRYAPPALKDEMDHRIARALTWLTNAGSSTTEDAIMQLLGAKWGGADSQTIQRFTRKVLALQRENGAWAQTPYLQPDAYATGKALYALSVAGGMPATSSAWQHGIAFLLRTQAPDGSWHVISRAPRFQPYFDGGFPYGHDQWISQWATGWSAIALSFAAPDKTAALN